MIITYEGQQYRFDLNDVTVKQALKIERFMGCSFAEWAKRLQAGEDMRARQVVGWLILHQGGDVPIEDTDFRLAALGEAIDKAVALEAAATAPEGEAVPTVAASTGPAAAGSSPQS